MNFEALTPAAIGIGVIAILLACMEIARRRIRRADRRSPITREMLRGPGHSLRARIDDMTFDAAAYLGLAPIVPLSVYAVYLQQRLSGADPSAVTITTYVLMGGGAVAICAFKIATLMRAIHNFKLGLEAELVTAEELNRLMHDGYHVFHDVPGDGKFNVDHVVIGPAGVFAIETKGRMKPTDREAGDGHVVRTDGDVLHFPGWQDSTMVAQARRGAQWVATWISSAVGERIEAKPVLSLPGWFVERNNRPGIDVLSAKEIGKYFHWQRDRTLGDKQIRQIVHQFDQRCRDVRSNVGRRV
jgi:hypothetical protein